MSDRRTLATELPTPTEETCRRLLVLLHPVAQMAGGDSRAA
jgi:hypothetical protein